MNTLLLLAQISAGGVIHILVYLLIAACIIGLIYYIAVLVFPTAANIIRVISPGGVSDHNFALTVANAWHGIIWPKFTNATRSAWSVRTVHANRWSGI
jgi:hypothetical protein